MSEAAYEHVKLVRNSKRPTGLDYIHNIFKGFIEFHGDRRYADDPAIVGGVANLNTIPVTVIGIEKGHTAKEIVIPFTTPKANVNLVYETPFKIDRKALLEMTVLREVLNLRFVSNIREKEGGTYGVNSKVVGKRLPTMKFTYTISFDTDLDKAEHLRDLVLEEIASICNDGITETEFDNIRKNLLKEREQSKSNNKFVIDNLTDYVLYGEDNASTKNYEDILTRLTASDIRKFARKFFGKSDIVDVIFANEFKD